LKSLDVDAVLGPVCVATSTAIALVGVDVRRGLPSRVVPVARRLNLARRQQMNRHDTPFPSAD
jgi:hypothetical protein